MALSLGAADLWMCAGVLKQVPALAWLSVSVAVVCALIYWALDFYFLEALLTRFTIAVETGAESPVSRLVEERCVSLKRRYRSTPWLCSPHLQTVYLHFDRWSPVVRYRREVFQLSDGGCVGLDWSGTEQPTTPTVAIIPGLTSDSSNAYLKYLVADITAKGWRSVVINHRGLGGVSLTSETFYNAGWTDDMREILSAIRIRLPAAPLALVGASLGANMVIKFLGEEGEDSPVWGAVAIGCPFDLLVCDRFMNRTFVQRFWNSALAHGLKEFAELHKEPFSKFVDFTQLQRSRTLREFDDRITRFTANFETVDTYYRRCSSAPFVTAVRTPLLALSALDDPICTKESIPWDECRLNPYVTLATAPRGGHLAIYDGWLPLRLWWTKPCIDFLGGIFDVGYKGLEPVQAANGTVPRGGLPLVKGVGEEAAPENGWAVETCDGVTDALIDAEVDPSKLVVTPKVKAKANGVLPGMNGVTHAVLERMLGTPERAAKPNGVLLTHAKEPNGDSYDRAWASEPWGKASEAPVNATDTPGKITGSASKASVTVSKASGTGDEAFEPRGVAFGAPVKASESPVRVSANSTPVRNGRLKRIVIEFADESQAAAVEAFLSEILEQMRGGASTPRAAHQSLNDAALAASSAAASASAVAAAAAAVVRSASAAAIAVRSPETPPQDTDSEKRAALNSTRYSELMSCYNRLATHGSKSAWLLAYVAVAVSFPLAGALLRMQAVQRVKSSERVLRLGRKVGLK